MSLLELDRYQTDTSEPARSQAWRDFARRTLLPAAGLLAVNAGVGLAVVGPLDTTETEVAVNEELVEIRTPVLDVLTQVWSNIGGTHFLILFCIVVALVLWRRLKQWWLAVVPAIALSVQSAVFTLASLVVGRGRPEVDHLDHSPPTSGFPSGHTGASTAFYLVLALLAQRIQNTALRWTVTVLCVVVPLLVGFSRLYRGMHHPTDVGMGLVNGVVCAVLAWLYLRRTPGRRGGAEDAGTTSEADRTDDAGAHGAGSTASTPA